MNHHGIGRAFLLSVVDCKVHHARPFGSLPHVVNLVTGHAARFETLGVVWTFATFTIDHGVNLGLVFPENRDVNRTLPDENLVGHLGDAHLGIERKDDDVIKR